VEPGLHTGPTLSGVFLEGAELPTRFLMEGKINM